MVKKVIWFLILLAIVGTSIYFIFFREKDTDTTDTNTTDTTNTETEDSTTEETDNDTEESTTDDTDTAADLTGFSVDEQTVGIASESEYTIETVTNSSEVGYHEFVFTLSSTGADDPYVVATYKNTLGVIRVDLNQVVEDNGGIGYQESVTIDKDGVSRLYHNVSSDQTEELYDIGVASSTTFKLTSTKTDTGWTIIIDVAYPGESTDTTVDLGSTEYSKEAQSIVGVDADSGATIASYTYGSVSGVMKFVWNVSSDASNPIPTVSAQYDSSNNLVVTFSSLKTDKVYLAVDGIDLPGSLALQTEKSGSTSIYTFSGMSDIVNYKLSASTSPNQVVLEIDY